LDYVATAALSGRGAKRLVLSPPAAV